MADLNELNDTLRDADNATADFQAGVVQYAGVIGDNALAGANDVDLIRLDLKADERV